MKHYSPTGRRNHGRPSKDFWIRETGTGQKVAQLHDRYMMMMTEFGQDDHREVSDGPGTGQKVAQLHDRYMMMMMMMMMTEFGQDDHRQVSDGLVGTLLSFDDF